MGEKLNTINKLKNDSEIKTLITYIHNNKLSANDISILICYNVIEQLIARLNNENKIKKEKMFTLNFFDIYTICLNATKDIQKDLFIEITNIFEDAFMDQICYLSEAELTLIDPQYEMNSCEQIEKLFREIIKEISEENFNSSKIQDFIEQCGYNIDLLG